MDDPETRGDEGAAGGGSREAGRHGTAAAGGTTAPAGLVTANGNLVIRPLRGVAEYRACVELQRETWGRTFSEAVPPAILWASQRIGGVTAGAFDRDGRLIGFVFGMTGIEGGRPVHWSDMLAVRPEARNRGLGERLKRYQRDVLLGIGVDRVYWTFDPLESKNAYINFAHLGIVAWEYLRDVYGQTDSPLHAGIGTDRLVAEWPIASDRVRDRLDLTRPAPPPTSTGRLLNPPADPGPPPRPGEVSGEPEGPVVEVAVPADIEAFRTREPELALAWRHSVRAAFEGALAAGYVATDMVRGDDVARYLLTRPTPE
jgi:predicted GNAT superfamily acetyltransferase